MVAAPFGLTAPLSVALFAEMPLAARVDTNGGRRLVVKVRSFPGLVPALLMPANR